MSSPFLFRNLAGTLLAIVVSLAIHSHPLPLPAAIACVSPTSQTDETERDNALTPIEVTKGFSASAEEVSWLVDPLGLGLSGDSLSGEMFEKRTFSGIDMSREWKGSVLVVTLARHFENPALQLASYETKIRIVRGKHGELEGEAAITYDFDARTPNGPPPKGLLSDLTGRVVIECAGWGEGAMIGMTLWLHGRRGNSIEWVQGCVAIQ